MPVRSTCFRSRLPVQFLAIKVLARCELSHDRTESPATALARRSGLDATPDSLSHLHDQLELAALFFLTQGVAVFR